MATSTTLLNNGLLPQPLGYLKTIESRQADVQQDYVRSIIEGCFQCGQAIVNRPHIMPRLFQQHSQRPSRIHIIIHHSTRNDGPVESAASLSVECGSGAGVAITGRRTTNSLPCPNTL